MVSSTMLILLGLMAASSNVVLGQKAARLLGGATSFSELGPVLVSSLGNNSLPLYASVGSGGGITSFINGSYSVAVSDDPMTQAQELTVQNTTGLGRSSKLTFPIVIASYGFFLQANATAKSPVTVFATWLDLFNMMKTGGNWSTFSFQAVTKHGKTQTLGALAGAKGKPVAITPISRQGNSGTTQVIKRFFETAANLTGSLAVTRELLVNNAMTGDQFPSSWVCVNDTRTVRAGVSRLQNGGPALCATLNARANLGFIGYSQRNLCSGTAANTTSEAKIRNAAGTFIASTDGDAAVQQVTPRSDLKLTDPWYTLVTVMRPGTTTTPIASFIFCFSRVNYTRTTPFARQLNATATVNIFNALLRTTRDLASKYGFTPFTANVTEPYLNTIRQLTKFI